MYKYWFVEHFLSHSLYVYELCVFGELNDIHLQTDIFIRPPYHGALSHRLNSQHPGFNHHVAFRLSQQSAPTTAHRSMHIAPLSIANHPPNSIHNSNPCSTHPQFVWKDIFHFTNFILFSTHSLVALVSGCCCCCVHFLWHKDTRRVTANWNKKKEKLN